MIDFKPGDSVEWDCGGHGYGWGRWVPATVVAVAAKRVRISYLYKPKEQRNGEFRFSSYVTPKKLRRVPDESPVQSDASR